MKFISFLLLLSFTTLINCQTVFINLQPFQTNQCFQKQGPIGVGYNVIANQCTINMGNFLNSVKSEKSIYFGTSVDVKGDTVVYGNYYESDDCTGTPTYGFDGYSGSCIETTVYGFINSSIPYKTEFPFIMVSTTNDTPVIPIGAQVYGVYNNSANKGNSGSPDCSTTDNELLFTAFITADYEIDYEDGVKEVFSCDSNHQPYVKYCPADSSPCQYIESQTCRIKEELSTIISCNYNLN